MHNGPLRPRTIDFRLGSITAIDMNLPHNVTPGPEVDRAVTAA